MKQLPYGLAVILLGLLLQLFPGKALGQVITAGPDSVQVITQETDTTVQEKQFFLKGLRNLDRPGKAAIFSAVIPGLGQAYNKAYWKIPIIYATGAVLGYFLIDNNNKYQDYRVALNTRKSGGIDKYYDHPILGKGLPNSEQALKYYRDYYRRNRDLTILLSVGAYTLNIAEAYVHAHMKDFDVSDNLSLRVQPDLMRVHPFHSPALTPGLTLTLYTKSK
ncbi:DUF5683 domain-containing protein [Pontibacter ruber]|uniref:DUF5683 domain-containing protein n=1 Tax=Pontibacter ruber TaxID=1343895 RepID=A0ABW5D2I2_9BACT|nr:DUF5683 domain-containing protein [Pontibacter ruber]